MREDENRREEMTGEVSKKEKYVRLEGVDLQ